MKLVLPAPVEAGEALEIHHPRLAEQDARVLVRIDHAAPSSEHREGLVEVDDDVGVRVLGSVTEVAVLDDGVRDVEAEAGNAALEPEAEDVVELLPDLLVPPVQVDLLGEEAVEVHLARRRVERPRGAAAERRAPVVRRGPVGLRIAPDVPVAPWIVA